MQKLEPDRTEYRGLNHTDTSPEKPQDNAAVHGFFGERRADKEVCPDYDTPGRSVARVRDERLAKASAPKITADIRMPIEIGPSQSTNIARSTATVARINSQVKGRSRNMRASSVIAASRLVPSPDVMDARKGGTLKR